MAQNIFLKPFYFIRHYRFKTTVIDGKSIANKILKDLKVAVQEHTDKKHRAPTLTAIIVGDDPSSKIYVKNKVKTAHFVGIKTEVLNFPDSISETKLIKTIQVLNSTKEVDSVLLQLPLPSHINPNIYELISPEKDVDGFTSANFGKFCLDKETIIPCTVLAVQKILQEINIDFTGKNALICGRSKHVGLPIAMLLHSNFKNAVKGFNANTIICHRFTPVDQLTKFCQNADVVITATGVPSLIRGYMVKKGSVIIDVGISRIIDPQSLKNKIVGDVNFEEVKEVAGFLTPVPGGVGPLTVAMLLQNTFTIARKRNP
ncbi:hypothetical protein PGB90_007881 [Kerria lacca]